MTDDERTEQVRDRLLSRLTMRDDGCWVWEGAQTKSGYGHMRVGEKHKRTHRLAWELLIGELDPGLELDHLCKTRLCANPAHLEPVDRTENLRRTKAHLDVDYRVNEEVFEHKSYVQAYADLIDKPTTD